MKDIVLLGAEWRARALLRAQLIEEGFDVVATETWPDARRHLRPGMKPRLLIVDVQGLPDPERVLTELKALMKPSRVLVLAAIGMLPADRMRAFGFHVVKRPIAIGRVIAAARRAIARA